MFYSSALGDRIIDAARYPPSIREFLAGEERLLDEMADESCTRLIEVGCMHGRHLDWAFRRNLDYLGIDLVSKYVERGRTRVEHRGLPRDRYRFVAADAAYLSETLYDDGADPSTTLVFFPFNSFGNMSSPDRVAESLAKLRTPFFISSYCTDERATQARAQYYAACELEQLRVCSDQTGVHFTSSEGFRSSAYFTEHLCALFARAHVALRASPFSHVGIAYTDAARATVTDALVQKAVAGPVARTLTA